MDRKYPIVMNKPPDKIYYKITVDVFQMCCLFLAYLVVISWRLSINFIKRFKQFLVHDIFAGLVVIWGKLILCFCFESILINTYDYSFCGFSHITWVMLQSICAENQCIVHIKTTEKKSYYSDGYVIMWNRDFFQWVNPFNAGIVFRFQNMTSVDVWFWSLKTVPTLKELKKIQWP